MAIRPAFFMGNGTEGELVREEDFNFKWYPGLAFAQKKKNVDELHFAIQKKYSDYKILEISSKSNEIYGKNLSAFNLYFTYNNKSVSVECAFQSSKVFENGGPYTELLNRTSREAKTDLRIRNSGKLKKFLFNGEDWDIIPTTSFYDWLYIKALHDPINTQLAKYILKYDCFTDIEFNPKRSFNCQARSAALYKYLYTHKLLEESMSSKSNYMQIINNTFNTLSPSTDEKNLLVNSINLQQQTPSFPPKTAKKIHNAKEFSNSQKSKKKKKEKDSQLLLPLSTKKECSVITAAAWMPAAVEALKHAFGPRLLFVGLQGSYRRGEATAGSDIDICVILDRLDAADLPLLRATLDALPEGEKAAGFVCGAPELAVWPAFELFAFARDMDAWHGDLAPLLPPLTQADIALGVRTAVAALYHEAAQALLLAPRLSPEGAGSALHSLRKSFQRALQGVIYLREGIFPRDREDALRRARGDEAKLLRTEGGALSLRDLAAACLAWSGARLRELPAQAWEGAPQRRKNAGSAK